MKIGIVTAFLGERPSGAAHVVSCFSQALHALGHTVVGLDNRPEGMPGWSGEHLAFPRKPGRGARFRWANFDLPGDIPVDAVIFPHPEGRLRQLKAAQWITLHDLSPLEYPQYHTWLSVRYFRHLLPRVIRNSKGILTHSRFMADAIEARGFPRPSVAPLYTRLQPGPVDDIRLRHFHLRRPYFLFLGVLEPRKNLVRLAESFVRFRKENPEYSLALAGPVGWKIDPFELDQAGLTRLGPLSETDKEILIRGSAGLVYPSIYEGFGIPLIEALACGIPVLTSDTDVLRETAGESAVLVDPACTESMIKGLLNLASLKPDPSFTVQADRFSPERTQKALAKTTDEHQFCAVLQGGYVSSAEFRLCSPLHTPWPPSLTNQRLQPVQYA